VQFDLRFYVVALVFLIFEVEVALFFPAATVFGTAVHAKAASAVAAEPKTSETAKTARAPSTTAQSSTLALAAMLDLGVFFAVLLVGFAYVWRRGDLDWVRAVRHPALTAESAAAVMALRGNRP
jgi:NADH-quinone oxidoreductase subunit A